MSADTCIAYFGLRFELGAEEIEGVELRSDSRVVAARRAGLKYYWGNFGGLQESHLLFVGTQLGIVGPENSEAVSVPKIDLQESIEATTRRLAEAGFDGTPSLHIQWQPDI